MDSEPMCRACLSESGDAVPIFSSVETPGLQMPLNEMLTACTAVQVSSGDGLPSLICIDCLRSLLIAYDFKQKCEKTDAMLREYVQTNLLPNGLVKTSTSTISTTTNTLQQSPMNISTSQSNQMNQSINATSQSMNQSNQPDIKPIINQNGEIISAIPIAINNATAFYNGSPYIIPMLECDMSMMAKNQDGSRKLDQPSAAGVVNQSNVNEPNVSNIVLKKMDSHSNVTSATPSIDLSQFTPLLQSVPGGMSGTPQIILGSDLRNLFRVAGDNSDPQQQFQGTTLVVPKLLENVQGSAVNLNQLLATGAAYTIDPNTGTAILAQPQSNLLGDNSSFMALPSSHIQFAVKDESHDMKRTTGSVGSTRLYNNNLSNDNNKIQYNNGSKTNNPQSVITPTSSSSLSVQSNMIGLNGSPTNVSHNLIGKRGEMETSPSKKPKTSKRKNTSTDSNAPHGVNTSHSDCTPHSVNIPSKKSSKNVHMMQTSHIDSSKSTTTLSSMPVVRTSNVGSKMTPSEVYYSNQMNTIR